MTNKRTPAPPDIASESELGEEDPGAAMESLAEPDEPASAPQGKPSPDTPLQSPMPRSPTLEKEEPPNLAHEEDIAPEDDAPSNQDAPARKSRGKVKKQPSARGSGTDPHRS